MTEEFWHKAQGDDLPPINKEVIVLTDNGNVYRAHRPNPDGFYVKNLDGKILDHIQPMRYDNGGWNIPNVKYWLDLFIPD